MKNSIAAFVAAVSILLSSIAYADDCGKNDRVPLPSCVNQNMVNYVGENQWIFYHDCPFVMYIKFDQPGRDKLHKIYRHSSQKYEGKESAKLSCCPKMGQCSE